MAQTFQGTQPQTDLKKNRDDQRDSKNDQGQHKRPHRVAKRIDNRGTRRRCDDRDRHLADLQILNAEMQCLTIGAGRIAGHRMKFSRRPMEFGNAECLIEQRVRTERVGRTDYLPIPAARRTIERRSVGLTGERDLVAIRLEHRSKENDLCIEPAIDLSLNEAEQYEIQDKAGIDQGNHNEDRRPNEKTPVKGCPLRHHLFPVAVFCDSKR